MKKRKLGRGVAIVGAGMSKFGMFKDKDSKDLFAEAFNGMIASVEKGVDPHEIEALYLGNFSSDFFMHHCSGVVELEEGGRVDARIEGVDAGKPEDIKVGMPLKVKYLHRGEGELRETYLAFEPE